MDQLAQAREILRQKREQKKISDETHSKILYSMNNNDDNSKNQQLLPELVEIKQIIETLQNHIQFLNDMLQKYTNLFNKFFGNQDNSNSDNVIYDLFCLYFSNNNQNTFPNYLFQMCCDIYEESKDSYEILCNYIHVLPPKQIIEEHLAKKNPLFSEDLTNIENLPKIIQVFKQEYGIHDTQKTYGCLAVDALYFKPNVRIDPRGIVSGLEDQVDLGKSTFTLFSRNLKAFTEYIKNNWKHIIKAGFVFQLNPLYTPYKPIVLHIIPRPHGKADFSIVQMLYEIKNILHRYRVEITTFAFDGDKAFKVLHQTYFQSYVGYLLKNNSILISKVRSVRMSSDLLHLCKRFRYRFLKNRIHFNFKKGSPFIDVNQIQLLFQHIPDIVFKKT